MRLLHLYCFFKRKPWFLNFPMQFQCNSPARLLPLNCFFKKTLVIKFSNAIHLCDSCHLTVFSTENLGFQIFKCNSPVRLLPLNCFFQKKTLVIKFSNAIHLCDFCNLTVFFFKKKQWLINFQMQLTCASLAT